MSEIRPPNYFTMTRRRPQTARTPRRGDGFSPLLTKVRATVKEATAAVRGFIVHCFLATVEPTLSKQLTTVERTFSTFCELANNMAGSIRPGLAPGQTMCTSIVLRASQTLLYDWSDLIDAFNQAAEGGPVPVLRVYAESLANIAARLAQLGDCVAVGALRSSISQAEVLDVRNEVIAMRREATAAFRLPSRAAPVPEDTGERTRWVIRRISGLFARSTPRCSMSTGEMMRMKVDLNAECNRLIEIVAGIEEFAARANAVRVVIARASVEIDNAFVALRIPLSLKLEFDEEEEDPLAKEEAKAAKEQEQHLDALKDGIGQIQQAIAETTAKSEALQPVDSSA